MLRSRVGRGGWGGCGGRGGQCDLIRPARGGTQQDSETQAGTFRRVPRGAAVLNNISVSGLVEQDVARLGVLRDFRGKSVELLYRLGVDFLSKKKKTTQASERKTGRSNPDTCGPTFIQFHILKKNEAWMEVAEIACAFASVHT